MPSKSIVIVAGGFASGFDSPGAAGVGDASGDGSFAGSFAGSFQFFIDVFRRRLRLFAGRRSFWLRSFVRLGNRYFVALRRKRMLDIFAQRQRIDVVGRLVA